MESDKRQDGLMQRRWQLLLGIVLILVGGVWGAQGFGWLKGSAMSDQTVWAVIGPVVALLGIWLIARGSAKR